MPNSLLSPLAKLSRWRSIAINCFHQKPDFLHPVRGTRVCLASFSCDVSCEKHGEVIFPGWHNRLYHANSELSIIISEFLLEKYFVVCYWFT
jgi:hypothetical protein